MQEVKIKVLKESNEIQTTVVQEAVWQINQEEVRFRLIENNSGSKVLIWSQTAEDWISAHQASDQEQDLISLIEDICEFEELDGLVESDHIKWNGEDIMYI